MEAVAEVVAITILIGILGERDRSRGRGTSSQLVANGTLGVEGLGYCLGVGKREGRENRALCLLLSLLLLLFGSLGSHV